MRRKFMVTMALVASLGVLLAACGNDEPSAGGTSSPTAEKCKAYKKGGQAARLAGGEVSLAGAIHALNPQAKPKVKIGFIGDLTGSNSSLVVGSRDGAKLAFKLANAAGDLPVEVEFVPLDNKEAGEQTDQ